MRHGEIDPKSKHFFERDGSRGKILLQENRT